MVTGLGLRSGWKTLGMGYEKEVQMITGKGNWTSSRSVTPTALQEGGDGQDRCRCPHCAWDLPPLGSKESSDSGRDGTPGTGDFEGGQRNKKGSLPRPRRAISSPEDTGVHQHTDAVGFLGASSIERIPVERAIRQTPLSQGR